MKQDETRMTYVAPELTVLGTVEKLTGILERGTPDLVAHGNIL